MTAIKVGHARLQGIEWPASNAMELLVGGVELIQDGHRVVQLLGSQGRQQGDDSTKEYAQLVARVLPIRNDDAGVRPSGVEPLVADR